jgi:hypothetical protein
MIPRLDVSIREVEPRYNEFRHVSSFLPERETETGMGVEVDAMLGSYVGSGALKTRLGVHDVERAMARRRPLSRAVL